MRDYNIDDFASKIAEEIVVAKVASSDLVIDAEGGKKVADFYTEIFNGIAETLAKSTLG